MDIPTADDIRLWSRVDFDEQEYTADSDLDREIGRAAGYLLFVTGRPYDSMPVEFVALVQQATQMRVEQQILGDTADQAETAADELVQSFSAGAYTEARRGYGDYKAANEALLVNKWPALNDLLWMLMTDAKRAYWRSHLSGVTTPAWGVVEVDWSNALRTQVDHPHMPDIYDVPGAAWPYGW